MSVIVASFTSKRAVPASINSALINSLRHCRRRNRVNSSKTISELDAQEQLQQQQSQSQSPDAAGEFEEPLDEDGELSEATEALEQFKGALLDLAQPETTSGSGSASSSSSRDDGDVAGSNVSRQGVRPPPPQQRSNGRQGMDDFSNAAAAGPTVRAPHMQPTAATIPRTAVDAPDAAGTEQPPPRRRAAARSSQNNPRPSTSERDGEESPARAAMRRPLESDPQSYAAARQQPWRLQTPQQQQQDEDYAQSVPADPEDEEMQQPVWRSLKASVTVADSSGAPVRRLWPKLTRTWYTQPQYSDVQSLHDEVLRRAQNGHPDIGALYSMLQVRTREQARTLHKIKYTCIAKVFQRCKIKLALMLQTNIVGTNDSWFHTARSCYFTSQ